MSTHSIIALIGMIICAAIIVLLVWRAGKALHREEEESKEKNGTSQSPLGGEQ